MYDLEPELADREDHSFWYVGSNMQVVKPGDIVTVECVIGEKFGRDDRVENLGKAATFLGYFLENEEQSESLIRRLLHRKSYESLSPEKKQDLARSPYFKAHFEGVGEVTFCGVECYWHLPEEV